MLLGNLPQHPASAAEIDSNRPTHPPYSCIYPTMPCSAPPDVVRVVPDTSQTTSRRRVCRRRAWCPCLDRTESFAQGDGDQSEKTALGWILFWYLSQGWFSSVLYQSWLKGAWFSLGLEFRHIPECVQVVLITYSHQWNWIRSSVSLPSFWGNINARPASLWF